MNNNENADKSREKMFQVEWPNGSVTVVNSVEQEKRNGNYTNLFICETCFAVDLDPEQVNEKIEQVYEKIEQLNQNELKGVYIFDESKKKIYFRSISHYKPSVFEDPCKFEAYIRKSKAHRLAKERFISSQ